MNVDTTVPSPYFSRTRPEMLPYVPRDAMKILDVGCGAGKFLAQFKAPGRELWGAEITEEAAELAKTVLDKVFCGDIDSIVPMLPQGYFDCIVFNDVLEHLVDPYSLLNRLKGNLSQRGVIVASIPNVRYFFHLRELLVDRQWKYRDYGILDRTHLRFFTRYSIEDMFRNAGFRVRLLEGINGFNSWKFSLLNAALFGHVSDMRFEQFACVAQPSEIEVGQPA